MNNLKRLLPYLRPHRRALALGLACAFLTSLLNGAFLYLAKEVLTPMLHSNLPNRLQQLNYFTGLLLVVALLRVFLDFGQTFLVERSGERVLAHLREDLLRHFLRLPVGFFERRRTGEIMSRLTNDLSVLQSLLTQSIDKALSAPVEVVIYLVAMFALNWRLSLLVIVILPPISLIINRSGQRIKRSSNQVQVQLGSLTAYLQEKVAAMRLIQIFGTAEQEARRFRAVSQQAYESTMRPIRTQASVAPLIEFIGMCGVTLALWFGAREVVAGTMAPEDLITFLYAVYRASLKLRAVAGLNLLFKRAETSATRLFEMLDTQPEVRDAPDAIDLNARAVEGHLKFENVRFAYAGSDDEADAPQMSTHAARKADVLHDISFEIKPGEVVALAGLSGGGKTTIASLVPRLYDPTAGRVSLDGLDLREVSLQSLRSHIGAVPQETTLFHGTIRDNIAYGRPDASFDEIVAAARQANADDFIRKQSDGYETAIGESGKLLSGGQRQRIAIARALLRDPKLLILDEATSSLDPESESLVQDAFATLMKGRTTLIIAHRFSTIQRADRILVLEAGRIVESGTHEQLLQARGRYFQLHQMQSFAAPEARKVTASDASEEATASAPHEYSYDGEGSTPPLLAGA